jgi:PRTRC genetic system protein E
MSTMLEQAQLDETQQPEADDDVVDEEEHDDSADEKDAADEDASADGAGDGADVATRTAAEEPTPIPDPVRTPVPALIQGLAKILGMTSLMILIQPTTDDQVLLTIQPTPAKGEPVVTAQPLQVIGTPAEIDEQLLEALADYIPARQFAIATAEQVAAKTTNAAKASAAAASRKTAPTATTTTTAAKTTSTRTEKKKAERKHAPRAAAPPPATPKTVGLTINVTPATASLKVVDHKNKIHKATLGDATTLPPGSYIITASCESYKTKIEQVKLEIGKPQTLSIELPEAAPTLFQ